jgi:hypothetical protein
MKVVQNPASACFYCKGSFARHDLTRDHVVPKWVLRLFPEFTEPRGRNYVTACGTCNRSKGSMPAAEFIRIRKIPGEAKKARKRWDAIVRTLEVVGHTDPIYMHYRRLVIRAFTVTAPGLPAPSLSPIGNAMSRVLMQDEIDARFRTAEAGE